MAVEAASPIDHNIRPAPNGFGAVPVEAGLLF